jgi:hypothetical protein
LSHFTGRDTLYQEDKSQVRTRSGPRVMAALRNLAICALRLSGRTDVTEATRWASRSMDRPFTILGLTNDLEAAMPGEEIKSGNTMG